jgi:hypothetical protein
MVCRVGKSGSSRKAISWLTGILPDSTLSTAEQWGSAEWIVNLGRHSREGRSPFAFDAASFGRPPKPGAQTFALGGAEVKDGLRYWYISSSRDLRPLKELSLVLTRSARVLTVWSLMSLKRCSTPISSASSAPISEGRCWNERRVGVPS